MNKYPDTFTYANSSSLLPHWQDSALWCGTDSEYLYKINCEQRPPGWTWENKPIRYDWNQEGYRAPEWEDIVWKDSHAIMGCSYVLGMGVPGDDTAPYQLAQQLGEPCINLGYAGGSCQTIQYNTLRMIELGWKPKTVSIIIPELARMTYFDEHGPSHLVPGVLNGRQDEGLLGFYQYWVRPPHHADLYARMAIKGAQALWQAQGVPVILRHAQKPHVSCAMAPSLPGIIDRARDLQHNGNGGYVGHPGPATLALWARELADEIRSL